MENEFSRVVDTLPGLVWTAGADGQTDFLNKRWRDYTGLGQDRASDRAWQDALHPDDRATLVSFWQSLLESGQAGETEARLRRFDGVYRWFLLRAAPLADDSGRIVKWCGINTDVEDRRRAEDALQAEVRRFHSIVDGLPTIVVLMRPDGQFEHANRHMLDYLGATLEELKARAFDFNWRFSFHPDDRDEVMARWLHSIETGDSYDYEARLRRADGVYRWVHIRGFPLRDAEGRIALWYLLQSDVDDRKRAEGLLAGEKRLLEMVASGSPLPDVLDALCRFVEETDPGAQCGVLFFAPDGATWQHAHGSALPSGYKEAMSGRPAHRTSGPCGLAAARKAPVVVADVELDSRWAAHGWRDLALFHGLRACWSAPILAQDRTALGALAIYRNEPGTPNSFQQDLIRQVTHIASIAIERTRGEDALKRSEAFLAQAQSLTRTGSLWWKSSPGEIAWSQETYRLLEHPLATTPSLQLVYDRWHPEDQPLLQEMLERSARDGLNLDFEHRLLMPDGAIKDVRVVVQHAGPDAERAWSATITDITERKRAEEDLDKARSELARVTRIMSLGALTASIAHEVNQPLSGIITNASTCLRMLGGDPPNIEGAIETARRTIRDGNRAADVITRLRALFGKEGATMEAVDLSEVAREVIALSSSDLQRNRVILRMEFAEDLPPVMGDRVQLQQVILNLLLNASDAMSGVDDRPRILVVGTAPDEVGRVRLSVRDSGVGLEPGAAERLFEAFYTTKGGGMGIGLSVSRSIIENHGGRLWASPNEGPGASFSFSVPRVPEGVTDADSRSALPTPVSADAGQAARIP